MINYNDTPLSDFQGFTPVEMHNIIYFPFETSCPIKLNNIPGKQLLQECPVLKIVIDLLSAIKENDIKLSSKGNLPTKIVKDIYNKKFLTDDLIEHGITKLYSEESWIVLHNVKIVLTLSGLVRKKHNQLHLTKKCSDLLDNENYYEIFYDFFKAFTFNFNWAYNDAYEDSKTGQVGFMYSLYLINKYGDKEREIGFYTDLYFKAFPLFIKEVGREDHAFHTRFIERFAKWFGFVEEEKIKGKRLFEETIIIKKTKFLEELIKRA